MYLTLIKMLFIFSICLFGLTASVSSNTIHVYNAHDLSNVLKQVKAGDTIQLADGVYEGKFVASHVRGSKDHPIMMTGSRKAVLTSTSYGFQLEGCSYWTLKGFTIANSKKGLVLDSSTNNTIDSIEVHTINEEGIHFRTESSDNLLQNSYIHHTGLKAPGFGEGVYVIGG